MKRLLVISGHFPPSSAVGALRPFKLVRKIAEHDWQPYVLTISKQCINHIDTNLDIKSLESISIERVPCWSMWEHIPLLQERQSGLLQKIALHTTRLLSKATQPFLPVDTFYPWALAATHAGISLVKRHKIDLIWATSPKLSFLVLAHRIWQKTRIPYIIDFRDVKYRLNPKVLSATEKKNIAVERNILQNASGITYAAPAQAETLGRMHPSIIHKPKHLAYNWFEAAETARLRAEKFDRPTIIHGGALYSGTRNLNGFFEALKIFRQKDKTHGEKIQFLQFDKKNMLTYLHSVIDQYGLTDTAYLHNRITRFQFLSLCLGADILLLVVGHDKGIHQHAGAIPGKLYDYFSVCRPILVIGPRDCEAARMVMQLNRGLAAPDDEPDKIADAIEQLLHNKGPSGVLDLSPERVRCFESAFAVRDLAGFFSDVLAEKNKP